MNLRKKTIVLAALLAASLTLSAAASAVTGGRPDGEGHPNVGALIAQAPGGGLAPVCSGVLIAPRLFLTAGHCVASLPDPGIGSVWVSFDSSLDPSTWTLHRGVYHLDPKFGHDRSDLHDLAVVLLDAPLTGIAPAALPPLGLLSQMNNDKTLPAANFTNVGYGYVERLTGGGNPVFTGGGSRTISSSPFGSLTDAWLRLPNSSNTAGQGGVCFGDSGGPRFLADSNIVVAITSGGDQACTGMSWSYRLDTTTATSFLGGFTTRP